MQIRTPFTAKIIDKEYIKFCPPNLIKIYIALRFLNLVALETKTRVLLP